MSQAPPAKQNPANDNDIMKYPSLDSGCGSTSAKSTAVVHDLIDISEPAAEKSAFELDIEETGANKQ